MQDKIKKQETLEEAAEKWLNKDGFNVYNHYDTRPSFIAGSKWQQEQIGKSEFLQKLRATKSDAKARRLIFEQFKKQECKHEFIRTSDSFDLTTYCKKCGINYKKNKI